MFMALTKPKRYVLSGRTDDTCDTVYLVKTVLVLLLISLFALFLWLLCGEQSCCRKSCRQERSAACETADETGQALDTGAERVAQL